MVKGIFAFVFFVFVSLNAFAESQSAGPAVFVSKEKAESQKTKTLASKTDSSAQMSSASTFSADNKTTAVDEEKEKAEAEAKAAEKEAEEKAVEKKTKGPVMGVSPLGFAVQYGSEKGAAKEIWFNFSEDMQLANLQNKSELQEGDTVSVVYGEMPDHRKLVKKIEMIKKKPEEKKEKEAPEAN